MLATALLHLAGIALGFAIGGPATAMAASATGSPAGWSP